MSTARRSRPGDGDPVVGGRRRWPALAVGLISAFMTLLDISIVNVAIPSIDRALGATPSDMQWVLSGYALAFALPLVPAGRLGDLHGRRNVFVLGIALFTISSALAGLARSPEWLVLARLCQGAAAGIVVPQVSGLIQELFPPSERGRPFGLLGATIGVSTAVGPLLGGVLLALGGTEHGWRWVFFVNLPVGILAVVLGWRLIPARPDQRPDRRPDQPPDRRPDQPPGQRPDRFGGLRALDPVGVLLLGLGVLLVLLPLVQREQWRGSGKWLLVPAGLLVLAGFAGWERRYARHAEPLFNLGLFRFRSYGLGVTISTVYFAGFTAIFFVFALYLQSGLHYSPLASGLAITPFALGSAGASALGGRIVGRFGRPLVAVGLVLVALALGTVVLLLEPEPSRAAVPWLVAAPLLVGGIGSGLVIAPNQTLTLSRVPVPQAGSAAGLLQTSQRIGSSAGIAGIGAVFFSALAGSRHDWTVAFRHALLVSIGFVTLALIVAVTDVLAGRRGQGGSGAA